MSIKKTKAAPIIEEQIAVATVTRPGKATALKQTIEAAPAGKGKKTAPAATRKTAAAVKKATVAAKPPAKAKKGAVAPAPTPEKDEQEPVVVRMGRPLKYTPEICERLIAFFNIEVESVVDVDIPNPKGGAPISEKQKIVNRFPTLTRFAASEHLTRETLHDWATAKTAAGPLRYPDFSYAYARAKDLQDALLTEGGLAGAYDARFAVFAAKNVIGWKDQIEQVIQQNVTTTSTEQMDAIYAEGIANSEKQRAAAVARRAAKDAEE